MNGAESIVRTLLQSGIDTCFANPGTSEMHFVAALDRVPGMRCVLGLQENVVTGMADGYYRATGQIAAVCSSIGPGATNTLTGVATAFADSIPQLLITGGVHTYMNGKGVLQELDRPHGQHGDRGE